MYRPATHLPTALGTFSWLLAFCLLLVALALALVHGRRLALVALVTDPISLLAAPLVLQWRGEAVNRLFLAGLAMASAVAPVGRRLGSGYAGGLPRPGPGGGRRQGAAGADEVRPWPAPSGGHPGPARAGDRDGWAGRASAGHGQQIGRRKAKGNRDERGVR